GGALRKAVRLDPDRELLAPSFFLTVSFPRPRTSASMPARMTVGVIWERPATTMLPLHHDPHFTFRFGDDRIIPRFHLEGVGAGRRVAVYSIDPDSGERLGLLGTAAVGDGGWVDLTEPIIVRAGEAFVAVPGPPDHATPGHGSATLSLTLLD